MIEADSYQKTLDYLYTFVDYSLVRNFRNAPGRFDLARMAAFADPLGNPHRQYPIFHVAGTKGKGSVSALCASALQAAGYRVGLYTSPHLQDFAERIQVNGQYLPHDDLVALVDEIRPVVASIPNLTWFEITTLLAFLYFARQRCTAAVIEVGLGGRLDATNIVSPLVSVITSLSYDHTAILGETLAEIAAEKAGIVKPGAPLVLAPQKEEARQVVARIAAERGSPLIEVGRDYRFEALTHSLEGQSFRVWPPQDKPPITLDIPLLGAHQVENAATAFAALQTATASGLAVSLEAIQQGFRRVSWPGRFEVLRREPPLVLDCAHNRDSALRLRQALDEYFPGRPVVLLFGASEDKDIAGMFAELLPHTRELILTRSFHPRAASPEHLARLAADFDCPTRIVEPLEAALPAALQAAGADAVTVAAGSIFIAAGVRMLYLGSNL